MQERGLDNASLLTKYIEAVEQIDSLKNTLESNKDVAKEKLQKYKDNLREALAKLKSFINDVYKPLM